MRSLNPTPDVASTNEPPPFVDRQPQQFRDHPGPQAVGPGREDPVDLARERPVVNIAVFRERRMNDR